MFLSLDNTRDTSFPTGPSSATYAMARSNVGRQNTNWEEPVRETVYAPSRAVFGAPPLVCAMGDTACRRVLGLVLPRRSLSRGNADGTLKMPRLLLSCCRFELPPECHSVRSARASCDWCARPVAIHPPAHTNTSPPPPPQPVAHHHHLLTQSVDGGGGPLAVVHCRLQADGSNFQDQPTDKGNDHKNNPLAGENSSLKRNELLVNYQTPLRPKCCPTQHWGPLSFAS